MIIHTFLLGGNKKDTICLYGTRSIWNINKVTNNKSINLIYTHNVKKQRKQDKCVGKNGQIPSFGQSY